MTRGLVPGYSGGSASDSHRLPAFVDEALLDLAPTSRKRLTLAA